MEKIHCFFLDATNSDNDPGRPELPLSDPRRLGPDLSLFADIQTWRRDPRDYRQIEIFLDDDRALEYHGYYAEAATFFSWEVCEILKRHVGDKIIFLPVRFHGALYFYPRLTELTDALDKEKSEIKYIDQEMYPPVAIVDYFVFDQSKLSDPMVFSVPEVPLRLLVTNTVALEFERRNLLGIEVIDAHGAPPAYTAHVRRTAGEVLLGKPPPKKPRTRRRR